MRGKRRFSGDSTMRRQVAPSCQSLLNESCDFETLLDYDDNDDDKEKEEEEENDNDDHDHDHDD